MRWILLICAILIVVTACETQIEYYLCPDNVTKVPDPTECPNPEPKCPSSCDDNNECTIDRCSAATEYKCMNEEAAPCDGNNVCEEGEFPWSADCPESCNDNNECTDDTYNFELSKCEHGDIIPCCGNKDCERGETYVNCALDCEQSLDINVIRYEKRTRFSGATPDDLTSTNSIFLIVDFKIQNINIDNKETLNYKESKGFYYDPFKMRIEDGSGKLYDTQYDSDMLTGYLDYDIILKGHTKGAALLFIVPKSVEHLRLVAYDKYGSRLDISEIY